MFHRGLPIVKGDSVGFNAGGLEVRPTADKPDDKIIDAAGKAELRFRARQIRVRRKLTRGGENFCVKPESMFASLIN